MTDPIAILENALTAGLTHPGYGDGPIALPLPMFQNSAIPDEVRDQFAQDAGLPHSNTAKFVAEAIIHTLQTNGSALTETIKTRTAAAETPQPAPTPAPTPTPRTNPTTTGTMHVTVDGQVLMTDLGDWKQQPPQIIADALKPGAQPAAWTKALLMAITDAATGTKAVWTMTVEPGRINITTSHAEAEQ